MPPPRPARPHRGKPARPPQQRPPARLPAGHLSHRALLLFTLLLILPLLALRQLTTVLDWRLLLAALLLISVLTWSLYARDKLAARNGHWRVPETTLHLVALAGGWPAAYLTQRLIRHKTIKTSFQITYWATVLLHQLLALEYLRGGTTLTALTQHLSR